MVPKVVLLTVALVALIPSASAIDLGIARLLEPGELAGVDVGEIQVSVPVHPEHGALGAQVQVGDMAVGAAAAVREDGIQAAAVAPGLGTFLMASAGGAGLFAAGTIADIPVGPVAVPAEPPAEMGLLERISKWLQGWH